jgi:hypothetical protein
MIRALRSLLRTSLFAALPLVVASPLASAQEAEPSVENAEQAIEDIGDLYETEAVYYQVTIPKVAVIVTPAFLLDAFFDMHANHWSGGQVNMAWGGEFIIRRLDDEGNDDFDLVFGLDWANIGMVDDFWKEDGDPVIDADWSQNNLSLLTFDVGINWITDISRTWDLYYGVGLGVGIVLGDFLKQDVDADCFPAGVDPFNDTDPQLVLDNCIDSDGEPLLESPDTFEEEDGIPPLIPALSLTLGTRWTISDNWIVQLETGFKNLYFYGGLELGYAWRR